MRTQKGKEPEITDNTAQCHDIIEKIIRALEKSNYKYIEDKLISLLEDGVNQQKENQETWDEIFKHLIDLINSRKKKEDAEKQVIYNVTFNFRYNMLKLTLSLSHPKFKEAAKGMSRKKDYKKACGEYLKYLENYYRKHQNKLTYKNVKEMIELGDGAYRLEQLTKGLTGEETLKETHFTNVDTQARKLNKCGLNIAGMLLSSCANTAVQVVYLTVGTALLGAATAGIALPIASAILSLVLLYNVYKTYKNAEVSGKLSSALEKGRDVDSYNKKYTDKRRPTLFPGKVDSNKKDEAVRPSITDDRGEDRRFRSRSPKE